MESRPGAGGNATSIDKVLGGRFSTGIGVEVVTENSL